MAEPFTGQGAHAGDEASAAPDSSVAGHAAEPRSDAAGSASFLISQIPSTTKTSVGAERAHGQNTIDEEDKTFIRQPGGSVASSIYVAGAARKQFGDYELIRELGRGGMGVVYEAVQTRLKRTVAVKMILSGQFASDEQVQRFVAEARSVANLDHPNIVPVYEVAEEGGLQFFSMKLVDGGSLSSRLSSFRGNVRLSAELVEKVAKAIHHAHQRGVLHRDLKPGNILIDKDGQPLVTDFGLAKIVADDSNVTRSDAIGGTPAYMAPEQARGARYATTATDIWALGAILYHLLTGVQPFKGSTSHETLKLVTESEPVAPRQRDARVPRDLETLCLKCLQKEPGRRYATAGALAADLRRFLAGEPVEARPVGTHERFWRWCRRNPGLATTGAAALLSAAAAILILSVAVLLMSMRERQTSQVASDNAMLLDSERARNHDYARDNIDLRLQKAVKQCALDAPAGLLALSRLLADAEEIDAAEVALSIRLQIAVWGDAVHPLRCIFRHEPAGAGGVRLVALSADGSTAFTEGADNHVRAFDTTTGKLLGLPLSNGQAASTLAADPATGVLLIGFRDGTSRWWHPDTARKLPPASPRHTAGQAIAAIAFADGRVLTCGHDGVARFWDTATGKQVGPELQHGAPISVCAVSEHADRCATGGVDGSLRLWRLATGEVQGQSQQPGKIWALSFRDLHQQLVVVTQRAAMLHRVEDGQPLESLWQPSDGAFAGAIAPDGSRALVAEWGSIARVTSLSDPREVRVPLRHRDNVTAQVFSGDGHTMITGSADGLARVWSLAHDHDPHAGLLPDAPLACLSRNGRLIVVATSDGAAVVLNARTGALVRELRDNLQSSGGLLSIAVSPDGRQVLTGSIVGTARLWHVASQTVVGQKIAHTDGVHVVGFSPDGALLVTGAFDGGVQISRSSDLAPIGPPIEHPGLSAAVFSPDGASIATAGEDGIARLWSTDAAREEPREFHHNADVRAIAFSPDQMRLATGGQDGVARLWDIRTGQPVGQPMRHQDQVQMLAFSPTGEWLATAETSRVVRMWNAETGQGVGEPIALSDLPTCLAFSEDGQRMMIGASDGSVVLWDVAAHLAVGPTLRRNSRITAVAFMPGGDAAMIAALGGDVRLQRFSAQSGTPQQISTWAGALTGVELDASGAVRVREEPAQAP